MVFFALTPTYNADILKKNIEHLVDAQTFD